MFFNEINSYLTNLTNTSLVIFFKSIYFISMLNMAITFLNFVYRLIERKYDYMFYIILSLNTITIFSRYLFPINYTSPYFWRIDEINVIVAALMATIFALPMVWSIFLIIKHYKITSKIKLKHQLRYVLLGIICASIISIISEYIFPALLHFNSQFSIMFLAILALILFLYVAIVRYQFLNVQVEYIYQKLFLFSNEGIILIDKDMSILSINQAAKEIFKNIDFARDMEITNYIREYDFNENYYQYETSAQIGNDLCYLIISQSPIDSGEKITAKLLHITDITQNKRILLIEKEQLIEQSTIDKLTGLYNKRYFIDNINNQKLATVDNLVLVFIDIDNFKQVNDNFGHLVGDDVIIAVAQMIKKTLRKDDKGIRYGGDEFLVVLENTSLEDAKLIADNIQKDVNDIKFDQCTNGCIEFPKITLSIGLNGGDKEINSLIEKADKAMYYSKFNGKNKSTIYNAAINISTN